MNDRFELVFGDVRETNKDGIIRNLLITDNNPEFRNSALKALYHWSKNQGISVVEIDESDESWTTEINSCELYEKLSIPNTVLLVRNYALHNSHPNANRSFLRSVAIDRIYESGSVSSNLINLLFVIAINDLSEMCWKEVEYAYFSIMHEDDNKKNWVDTEFARQDSKMHPVMSRVNKAIYFVSDDETTLLFDAGDAFGSRRLKRPIRYYSPEDRTDIIHAYIENNLPYFSDKVEHLILKMGRFTEEEHFVIDGKRLKKSFPNLSNIYCKDVFDISDPKHKIRVMDPFSIGEMCFNLAQNGDVQMANLFVRNLWALDRRWASFFREVAIDYYRKPEDHAKFDPDSALHNWTGMDNIFRSYFFGWYHAGDDFFDEEDKVYVSKHKNIDKALGLLPVRFKNCSIDEVADKLYWDLRHLQESTKPDYLLFAQVLAESEKICPGVLDKMRDEGFLSEDFEIFFPIRICNMCGKTFDFWDHEENASFDHIIGYGSSHDMHRIKLNLCCNCFDKVLDWILPKCKHNPLSEYN